MRDAIDSRIKHDKHVEKLAQKHLAYEAKLALLQMWEERADGNHDHEYLTGLRKRVRGLKCQLMAMRPAPVSRAATDFDD